MFRFLPINIGSFYTCLTSFLAILLLTTVSSFAEEGPTGAYAVFVANNVWMLVATFLVFIMHMGFATLETGLTRSKNTVPNQLYPAAGYTYLASEGLPRIAPLALANSEAAVCW